jgi:acetyltransferase
VISVSGQHDDFGIDAFFAPNGLAVFGASLNPNKLGYKVIKSSVALRFAEPIFGVNPRSEGKEVAGRPLVRSLSEINERVDLAYVAVPAAATLDVVRECARSGIRAAVLLASGLGERDAEGSTREAEIGRVAADAGMRLLGPNGYGLFSARVGLNLTSYPTIPTGRVALMTQSGNAAIALFRQARYAGIGFSSCAGLGNQLDVNFADLIGYHAQSNDCDALALYIEGLPMGNGRRLRDALFACQQLGKPVVVLKGGRSTAGSESAATHTGVLSGSARVWDAVFAETGALSVDSTEAMVDVLAAVTLVRPTACRVLVLTDGGGDSVMAVDALSAAGIPLAHLSPATETALEALTPPAAPRVSGHNPVTLDTAGGLEDDAALIARCAVVGADDPGVDVVVVSGTFGGYVAQRDAEMAGVAQLLAIKERGTPVLVHSAFAQDNDGPVKRLSEVGIPVYSTVRRLAAALAAVKVTGARGRDGETATVSSPGFRKLGVEETASLLRRANAVVPSIAVVHDRDSLFAAAADIGYPICLKVEDPAVSHKSDVDGVRLNLDPDGLVEAADDLWNRFPTASLLIMPMLRPGLELLIGAAQDPNFGAVITVGRGGVTTELDPDVALLLTPVTAQQARSAWLSLRCAPLLEGWRGAPAVSLDALVDLTVAIAELATNDAELSIECNPVIAYCDGYGIADMRAVVVD